MTVLSELSKIAYIGSSSQTLYPIPFEYINTDDVKVSIYTSNNEFVENWTYSIQYVIEGGNVKVLSGYNIDNTKKLLILRSVDLIQDNKYREGGDFPAKSTETSFDKLTMITQQLQETLDRCVKVEVLDNQTPEELLQTVYDKLDSATEIAGDAISAANQAQTAADNATAAVTSAEQTLVQTQAYVDSAKVDINNTKNTAINTINSTVSTAKGDITNTANNATSNITSTVTQAKTDINAAIDEATMNISNTSTSAINTINTAVSNAESNISTIVSDAEGSITNIAVTEANKAIANAAQEATDTAKANVNSYVDGTVKPSLQTYVDQAQEDANSAATSMEQAALSATAASNYASNASADADNAAESAGLAANSASEASIHNFKNKITNCITEIPQDIKLELNNGTLTLKAGSKVYVPNGSGVFDEITTTKDYSISGAIGGNNTKIFIAYRNNNISSRPISSSVSGAGATSTGGFAYDTTTNKINFYNSSGALQSEGWSFPIAIISTDSTGIGVSIDQVFNGFGYIGSTVFALPGVKGLIPNGRNADGSLKNIEFSYTSVKTYTVSGTNTYYIRCADNYLNAFQLSTYYDEVNNYNIWNNIKQPMAICGMFSYVDNKVTSLTPKTAFHAVDWNDFEKEVNTKQDISNLSQTIDDSTTKYPSNKAVKTAIDAKGGGLEIGDIGFAPLGIDEAQNKRRYLNGQVISQSQFASFTNKIKAAIQLTPSLATTETNWQAEVTNSKLGQCGKFVIDDVAGTIRLPKVVNINGLQDLALMGGIKAESLPNITGSYTDKDGYSSQNIGTGAFRQINSSNTSTYVGATQMSRTYSIMEFDASLSSSTYQDNAHVQQEAVQYPYFIQVATGVEETVDVTREIELNNPFSLLDYKWSEYELNNASWLLSNGAFNSGTVYKSVYELLLKIKNGTTTKAGVSVKLSTEAYTDTDFVLNTSDTTFRLPVKVKLASGNAVVGNGKTLGLTNGTANAGLIANGGDLLERTEAYGTNVGSTNAGSATFSSTVGITTDPTKSGIETSSSGLKLYFYVGETIQDANVIAASQVLTRVADLSDSYISGLGMPSSKYINLTLGASGSTYTAPANGWFVIRKKTGVTNGCYHEFNNHTSGFAITNIAYGSADYNIGVICPVKKGDVVKFNYSSTGSTNIFRFIYAEGEN